MINKCKRFILFMLFSVFFTLLSKKVHLSNMADGSKSAIGDNSAQAMECFLSENCEWECSY